MKQLGTTQRHQLKVKLNSALGTLATIKVEWSSGQMGASLPQCGGRVTLQPSDKCKNDSCRKALYKREDTNSAEHGNLFFAGFGASGLFIAQGLCGCKPKTRMQKQRRAWLDTKVHQSYVERYNTISNCEIRLASTTIPDSSARRE
jgi:hypothetical protein